MRLRPTRLICLSIECGKNFKKLKAENYSVGAISTVLSQCLWYLKV